ncbi:MAG: sigma-54-dependent Fis family transcriptional regulator [Bacteroidetes bacterium]|nr:sigma-54-dependent Fis family transcriptional regulator [Bacteroidota bacterium]
MARILIIEDDLTFLQILENFLKRNNHSAHTCFGVKDANKLLSSEHFDLALLDYRLPDGTGMDILNAIQSKGLQLPVIIMTSFHDIRTAVKSIRSGAYDYITKPVNPDELLMLIQEALAKKETKERPAPVASGFVEGDSSIARQLHEHISLVAPTNMTVIIEGESGTGKEQVARKIHALSKRSDKPFVAIDCGALSPDLASSELFGHTKGAFTGALQDKIGQFEMANGGTLFLDEVGNLSYEVQVKLLRALQEKEIQPVGANKLIKVDVRIITATNEDLQNAVKKGDFREDLYHRLNEFKFRLPSLHQRGSDIELFIAHFIKLANNELNKSIKDISEEVRTIFYRYDWPGNLRELKNVIKRAVLLSTSERIAISALPDEMVHEVQQDKKTDSPDLKAVQATNEKELIMKTLKEVKYNKSKAAKLLNIDRTTLYYKMSKYGIEG